MLIAVVLGWLLAAGLICLLIHGAEVRRHDIEAWEATEAKRHKETIVRQYLREDQ